MRRCVFGLLLVVMAAFAAAAPPPPAGAEAAGSLTFSAVLQMRSTPGSACPAGSTATTLCALRTGSGVVRGLGQVTEEYVFLAETRPSACPGLIKVLAYPVVLRVAGKGRIQLEVAEAPNCFGEDTARTAPQSFTVTGGTGLYAGASGAGRVERVLGEAVQGSRRGTDTWRGTLVVPNLVFDLTRPVLSGLRARTVRAPSGATRVRVRYAVTARDAVDGVRPVACVPKPGSFFRIGVTTVRCSASDTSGNRATGAFRVTVRRG